MMSNRRHRRWALAAAAVVMASAADHLGLFGRRGHDRACYDGAVATVTRVIDGDTVEIDLPDGRAPTTRLRLRGVACPALGPAPGEAGAGFSREAADFVQEHVEGRRVVITLDPNRPPRNEAGDLLAYLQLVDTGESLNELLIAEGLAVADSRAAHVMSFRWRQVEDRARREGRGLWRHARPVHRPD